MRINRDTSSSAPRSGPPTEGDIRRLVTRFYDRVREDEVLGPVFSARIDDWGPHLDRMCDFWSGVLRASGRYLGNPIRAHAAISGLEPAHFERWLELFRVVARETLDEDPARDVVARAERMSQVLQRNHPEISAAAPATSHPSTTP